MNKFARIAVFAFLALGAVFTACSSEKADIVFGREWNPGSQVVADTASEMNLNDPLFIQFRYGKGFDFQNLEIAFYDGAAKAKEIWKHSVKVNDKMNSYTLHGKSKRGGYMSARELTKQKGPGTILVEVRTEGKVLASKELKLVDNK